MSDGIPTEVVAALLQGLANAGPDTITAVGQMLMSASQGEDVETEQEGLEIEPELLSRAMEAARAGKKPMPRGAGLDQALRGAMQGYAE